MEKKYTQNNSHYFNQEQYKIAIVDDEPDIVELIKINLHKNNYNAVDFGRGKELFKYLEKNSIDLLILDLMLPDSDGFEICRYLKNDKEFSKIPVIILSARSDETEKILGLELGADDYITKPFSPRELVTRVKVILRRNEKQDEQPTETIRIGNSLLIDLNKYEVKIGDEKIEMTSTEFKILSLIGSKKGWVYSREQILNHLGVVEKGVLDRTVDVHIKNLREKLGSYGKYIKNIRGVGYKIEEN